MRNKLIAGNWKMYGNHTFAQDLTMAIAQGAGALPAHVQLLICPTTLHIATAKAAAKGCHNLHVGAQNVCTVAGEGAYTGEVSAQMLVDAGCSYVIVGHSERRSIYGECNATVATKYQQVQAVGLTPILCVGETLAQREAGETEAIIAAQLQAVLDVAGVASFAKAVIAYEPVWAIGTGLTATPEQAQQVHVFIRSRIAAHDATIATSLIIQYGGSVKPDNAEGLFAMPDIDGALIGGASLKADSFLAIASAAV